MIFFVGGRAHMYGLPYQAPIKMLLLFELFGTTLETLRGTLTPNGRHCKNFFQNNQKSLNKALSIQKLKVRI